MDYPKSKEELETYLIGERATLTFIYQDVKQIYYVGRSLVEEKVENKREQFLSMFASLEQLKNQYMNQFKHCIGAAIFLNSASSFPTDEDIKKRTEFNSYCYKVVEYYMKSKALDSNEASNISLLNTATLNTSSALKSRLPKFEIPKFSGNFTEWGSFKQLFEAMIIANPDISEIEKFYHLKGKLEGQPKKLISSYLLEEENFKKSWEALCKYYDNKRLLAAYYVDTILDFTPPKGPATLSSLQSFVCTIAEGISALKAINIPHEADFIWLTLALRKLDPETRRDFEIAYVKEEWPTFANLETFIRGRCKIRQLSEPHSLIPSKGHNPSQASKKGHVFAMTSRPSNSACYCNTQHPLHECPIFKSKSVNSRRAFIKDKMICFNCLKPGHLINNCNSSRRCRLCQRKHNTLLCTGDTSKPSAPPVEAIKKQQSDSVAVNPTPSANQEESSTVIASVLGRKQVILGTAIAFIADYWGNLQRVRIFIDSGSQYTLITSECARRLGLHWSPSKHKPLGAGGEPVLIVKGELHCKIISRIDPSCHLEAAPLVVSTIVSKLPMKPLVPLQSQLIDNHQLADPRFWEPRGIDFLLGAELFMEIISSRPIKLTENYKALPTTLGLVVMGAYSSPNNQLLANLCCAISRAPISDHIISKFWETEEIQDPVDYLSSDPCEIHFLKTHYREPDGRYVVAYPFKELPEGLQGSKHLAIQRFLNLEAKMEKNPSFKEKYHAFMREYAQLGHMSPTTAPSSYVIPHHGVFKSHDPNGKIRVVFDASARTPNGSLNDKLYAGPKLQRDLSHILMNFRRHAVAVTSDLKMMFRQIKIRPQDRKFQHIVFRFNSNDPIQTYELNTVTYGTTSAPYDAKRCIIQLVRDEGEPYPLASVALLEESYVDDIVSGAENLEKALRLKDELVTLLAKGKFQAHKWNSNSEDFMRTIEGRESSESLDLSPKDSSTATILGMSWDANKDQFFFNVNPTECKMTKRGILSVIARLFDPMGFLAPVIFKAKTILQATWKSQAGWDENLDSALTSEWSNFYSQLHLLNDIKIPRYTLLPFFDKIQLVGFCDASQKGFSAVLYLRVTCGDQVKISLLQAKTRLSPLKTISIPRLELSAAHLLVKLILSIQHFIKALSIKDIFLLTDSTIVLAWLRLSPHTLQTFVANRVSFIVSHTSPEQWFHVISQENPADVASRGVGPAMFNHHTLWWAGPEWLQDPNWMPISPPEFHDDIPERKSGVILTVISSKPWIISFLEGFSSYRKMIRTIAYILRFVSRVKRSSSEVSISLTAQELENALMFCVRSFQQYYFREDFSFSENRPISKRMQVLSAYCDEHETLRVGGRLMNANLPSETKHPVILPGPCHLTSLLINHLHLRHFHLGFQALQALIRRRFWIFKLRQTIKAHLSKCIQCIKINARPKNPYMGELPSSRVLPSRPFSSCGVDYAGPFNIKISSRRNAPTAKAYLCVFVCMATKATHLELVSSLSTDSFLATLDRFVARRGRPRFIHSDCGSNFIGANRQLTHLFSWLRNEDTSKSISTYAADNGFEWIFNPPHAPHFGGLWESTVKSTKRHLYKVLGDRPFTFEELATIFTKIEAVLNSRPLCVQNDTVDGDILTPGHFLIGTSLLAMPEQDLTDLKLNTLSRWQLVTLSVQHFWKRWHSEYLQSLQKRTKWFKKTDPFKPGDLVLIPDQASAPLVWRKARIHEIFPGRDGIVRVVSIRDTKGIRKLPVHNIVSLSHIIEPAILE